MTFKKIQAKISRIINYQNISRLVSKQVFITIHYTTKYKQPFVFIFL